MTRNYRELAGQIIINAYNSKSTVESIAASLEAFEKEVKRESAQLLIDEWKDLDSFCKKCDDQNEEMYSWCDFSCMLMNQIASVIRKLGFYIDSSYNLKDL